MKVLIDGYNLLAVTGHRDRDALIADLVKYRSARGHEVTVVFDGTKGISRDGSHSRTGDIHVLFSPMTVLADDTIEQLLDSGSFNECVTVTSDRRVQRAALRSGAFYAESREFAAKLRKALSGEIPSKIATNPPMRQPGPKLSKIEAERRRRLKKL